MFLKIAPKGPSQFSNVFLLTACLGAFIPVDYPTLLHDGGPPFGATNRLMMVLFPLK